MTGPTAHNVTDQPYERIPAVLRRAIATRGRRWLLAVTLAVGVVAAMGIGTGLPPASRTFAAYADPVQSAMSVFVPFFGVLLARDLRGRGGTVRLTPSFAGGMLLGAIIGAWGGLLSALAVALMPSTAPDPWRHVGTVAVGGVLIQMIAFLVGMGFGLLLSPPLVACLATIVVPLGLWLLLGSVDVLRAAQAWLTPYPSVRTVLTGQMTALAWIKWAVVVLIWDGGLNAAGVARLRRTTAGHPPPTAS
ncbi:MAG TPA: hypothetical protein VK453_14500 [Micromonosporaceae bacterium]|nr:hypothetical protein [Micromonosporaceae bacterium]